ncbi:Helix-turn-helix domain protein [compost metagenome]
MTTADFIEAIRSDIESGLYEQLLKKLQPEIERRLYASILDLHEACRYLKVSESTLRRMTKEDGLPYFRQRGQMYFRQIDLDKYVESRVVNRLGSRASDIS